MYENDAAEEDKEHHPPLEPERNDHALRLWVQSAAQGYTHAHLLIGNAFYYGRKVGERASIRPSAHPPIRQLVLF